MDTWETHYRSSVSESGASRSLIGFGLTDQNMAYMGRLVANKQSAVLSASGSMINNRDDGGVDLDLLDEEDDCVSCHCVLLNKIEINNKPLSTSVLVVSVTHCVCVLGGGGGLVCVLVCMGVWFGFHQSTCHRCVSLQLCA